MSHFTKKPVTISAIQWTGDNLPEVIEFTGKHPRWGEWFKDMGDYAAHVRGDGGKFKIFTLEGVMDALPGDWIIRGIQGEFYPCKPDIFAATYSPASTFNRPMSNIDKQALREAAEKATPGEWKRMMRNSDELMTTFHGIAIGNVFVELTTGKRDIFDAEFIAASNPATVLALLDELEAAENRIAELEAREVKPVKGEVLVTVSGFTGCGKSAIAGEIEIAMKAIGVPVTWSNGDAEKRMTGADWLTAIEMYKPTVRIIEVNVPRAAAAGKGEAS